MGMTMKAFWKCLMAFTLLTSGLVSMTAEKTSFVWTLRTLRDPDVPLSTWYAALLVMLGCPYLLALLHTLWSVSFLARCSDSRLPPLCAILSGVVGSVVEGACVVGVSSQVFPYCPVPVILPALGCVLTVSPLLSLLLHDPDSKLTAPSAQTSEGERTRCGRGKLCLSVLGVVSPPLAALPLALWGSLHWLHAVLMPVCLLLLALLWFPRLQRRALSVKGKVTHGCRRLTLVYTLLKLASVAGFVFADLIVSRPAHLSVREAAWSLCQGFHGLLLPEEGRLLTPLLVNVAAGLLSHALSCLSLALCQPLMGMFLPSVMSTATSVVLCAGVLGPFVYHADELRDFGGPVPALVSGGILVFGWVLSLVLGASNAVVKKHGFLFMPYDNLLLDYGWCAGFSDHRRLLSCCVEDMSRENVLEQQQQQPTDPKSCVYVCTTMYHEADYEMERLLLSISKISGSDKLKGVYLEAHIFMDNGVNDSRLGDFAEQLVGLLVNTLGMDPAEARCMVTPYGLQLNFVLLGAMPLFVHFKDPLKIKPKKRWSQCMYVKYVLDFRKTLWRRHDDSSNLQALWERNSDSSNQQALPRGDPDMFFHENENENSWTKLNPVVLPHTLTNFTELRHPSKHSGCHGNGVPNVPVEAGVSSVSNGGVATKLMTAHGAHNVIKEGVAMDVRTARGAHNVNNGGLATEVRTAHGACSVNNRGVATEARTAHVAHSVISGGVAPEVWTARGAQSVNNRGVATEMKAAFSGGGQDLQQAPCQAPGPDTGGEQSGSSVAPYPLHPEEQLDEDHTYILATDADMDFEPEAIAELLRMCNGDQRIGAACGRTHPIGKQFSAVVCHQIFEYAKDFWMIKNASNVIGSVMCCPGCFSLYRARALRQVMDTYATPTTSPSSTCFKDTGEDRWMSTLMMVHGWRLRYSAFAHNGTYCPDTLREFFTQRRRWNLSDMANMVLVVWNVPTLVRNNECFTLLYVIYLLNMFINNLLIPGTATVMITAGLEQVFHVPYVYTTPLLTFAFCAYAFLCTCSSAHVQTVTTTLLTLTLGTAFTCVALGGCYYLLAAVASEGAIQFQHYGVIVVLTLGLLLGAVLHPLEMHKMLFGLAYLLFFPAMHILLPLYSTANIVDQSWGTRDNQSAKSPKMECIPSLRKLMKRRKKNKDHDSPARDRLLSEDHTNGTGDIQRMVTSMRREMADGNDVEQAELEFWERLRHTLLANDVNVGLERAEVASGLERLRDRCLAGLLLLNVLWLALLSFFYVGNGSPEVRLYVYGVLSGVLYGVPLTVQVVGMTVSRVQSVLTRLARYLYGDHIPVWACPADRTQASE